MANNAKPAAQPKRVLCHVSDHASAQCLRWLIEDLSDSFETVGIWIWPYSRDVRERAACEFSVKKHNVEIVARDHEPAPGSRGLRRLIEEKSACNRALAWNPDIILQFHNSADDMSSFLNLQAAKAGTSVILLPVIKQDLPVTESLMRRQYGAWVHGPMAKVLGHVVPGWMSQGKTLRLPPAKILALIALGLAPENAWIPEKGPFRTVLAESPFHRETLLRAGLDSDKVVVTGHPVFDRLTSLSKNAGHAGTRPVVLAILPPFPPEKVISRPDAMAIMNGFIADMETLEDRFSIRFSLHPRLEGNAVPALRERPDLVSDRLLEEEMAECNIVIGSNSNVLSWAALMGLTSINYDLWELGGTKYTGYPDIVSVDSRQGFLEFINGHGTRSPKAEANRVAPILDGKAVKRIIAILLDPLFVAHKSDEDNFALHRKLSGP